jgi:hypothetical protein
MVSDLNVGFQDRFLSVPNHVQLPGFVHVVHVPNIADAGRRFGFCAACDPDGFRKLAQAVLVLRDRVSADVVYRMHVSRIVDRRNGLRPFLLDLDDPLLMPAADSLSAHRQIHRWLGSAHGNHVSRNRVVRDLVDDGALPSDSRHRIVVAAQIDLVVPFPRPAARRVVDAPELCDCCDPLRPRLRRQFKL